MPARQLITLTTDFGYADPFVGVMKGVIYSINPGVKIVDLTHNIDPQNVKEAAFTIGLNYRYFPSNSIHMVVVDPGVGSERRPLLVAADGHYFIGPDNGIFSHILRVSRDFTVIHILSDRYFLKKESPTFQGRDIFAPCAAWLSTGLEIHEFGEAITDYNEVDLPSVKERVDGGLQGEVIHIDRFGNATTNITKKNLEDLREILPGKALKVFFRGKEIGLSTYYSQLETGNLGALLNSSDLLELFVYRDNAAAEYHIATGDIVEIFVPSSSLS